MPVPFAYSTYFGWLGGVPLVDVGDVVYVGDGTDVLAVGPDGSIRWNRRLGRPVAIGGGGVLYVVRGSGVEAVSPDGTVSWTHPWTTPGAHWWPSITMGIDGSLYVGEQSSSVLTALRPDGSVGWRVSLWSSSTSTGNVGIASDAIGPTGTIYVATSDSTDAVSSANQISALSPTGAGEWSLDSIGYEQPVDSSAVVASDGSVYIAVNGGTRVFGPDGTQRPSLGVSGALSAGADGDVFVNSGRLSHIRADGTTAWSIDTGHGGYVVVVNDAVYLSLPCDGKLSCTPGITALNMNGEPLWTLGGVDPVAMVVGESTVYALEIDLRNQQARLVAISD